jgi:hypothetical protein
MTNSSHSARVGRTPALRLSSLMLAATVAWLVAGTAAAAGAPLSHAQQRYQQERAVCLSGQSNQDRATCLQEAGAALHEARRGGLDTAVHDLGQNRIIRCDALPAQDRDDCVRRMQGEGVTTGSAQDGGMLRELARSVAPK